MSEIKKLIDPLKSILIDSKDESDELDEQDIINEIEPITITSMDESKTKYGYFLLNGATRLPHSLDIDASNPFVSNIISRYKDPNYNMVLDNVSMMFQRSAAGQYWDIDNIRVRFLIAGEIAIPQIQNAIIPESSDKLSPDADYKWMCIPIDQWTEFLHQGGEKPRISFGQSLIMQFFNKSVGAIRPNLFMRFFGHYEKNEIIEKGDN